MGAQRGYKRQVYCPYIEQIAVPFHVTDVAGVPTFVITTAGTEDLGGDMFTLTDNGTGDYTLTLKVPAKRILNAPAPCPDVANLSPQVVSRTNAAIRWKFTNNSGTATDTGFGGVIFINDDVAYRG